LTNRVPFVLAIAALIFSVGALAVSLTSHGPRGHRGLQGEIGPAGKPGPTGPEGPVGGTAAVDRIQDCLPEFTNWVSAFKVVTSDSSNNGTFWLTNAYLDQSGQQVSLRCKKVLGLK
jgi:hypothetical protein